MPIRREFEIGWADASDPFEVRYVEAGNRLLPPLVEVEFPGDGEQPSLHLRLELVDGLPQCRELRITAADNGREVRPLDLAAVRIAETVDDVYALFAMPFVETTEGDTRSRFVSMPDHNSESKSISDWQQARKGKGARRITPQFLERCAQVYKDNFDKGPIAAVARANGVSERSASAYITEARRRGILPKTTRGKKMR